MTKRSSLWRRASRGAPTATFVCALLLGAAGALAAQQQPGPRLPARAPADTTRVTDPRQVILERLRRLDARRDTTADSTAVADSIRRRNDAFTLSAPVPRGGGSGSAPAAPQIQADSVMKALERLEGFTVTEYAGAKARFAADTGRLVLTGPAQVAQAGQAMTADSTLVYNQKTQIACGYGKPVLSGAGQGAPVESDQVCYDVEKRMGVAFGAKTKFQPDGQQTAWYVDGHKVYTMGRDTLFGQDAEFTDCNLAQPHYHFTAKEVKIVNRDVLVARNVVLSFADVPVFWLPFMVQSMAQGRRSGILMPRFDLNDIARTNAGYQRRIQNVGFYWAMNRNLGTLVTMDWFSGNYTAVNGAFDYSFRRQFLNGGLSVKEYWQQNGSRQTTLSSNNSWRPDERTSLNVGVSFASSSQFVVQQSFDPLELNRSIDSNLALQRRFNWGSLDLAGSRRQYLQTDRVSMQLPSIGLSVVPVTFFRAAGDNARWYNNLTWSGISANYRMNSDKANNPFLSHTPGTKVGAASLSTSLNLGKFSWSQSVQYSGNNTLRVDSAAGKIRGRDTVLAAIPGFNKQRVDWSTSISVQQRLFGTSTISPSLSINGKSASVDTVGYRSGMVAAPIRYAFGASTQMDVFGFWPGIGPFGRIRHKLSPSFGYSYSPALDPIRHPLTEAQKRVFADTNAIAMQSQLRIGLNQTFEAKYKSTPKDDSAAAATASEDSLSGEPRRLPQERKITLLAISSGAVVYDFARDTLTGGRRGFTTTSINNDIRSELIPGLQLSISHDLFRCIDPKVPCTGHNRVFSPYLTQAGTSFNLDDRSWLFRLLGLASHIGSRGTQAQRPDTMADTTSARTSVADQGSGSLGLAMVPGANRQRENVGTNRGVGSWNSSFTYSLARQRPGLYAGTTSQMLTSRFSFHPTLNWTVGWSTAYNFTQKQFADHVLTLTRDLHDWEAHFDFVKAQNGNFTVQFRVSLKAQPDLKFDYRQAGGDAYRRGGFY